MIDISGDYALWESIKNKTVIGGTGLFLNHTQENGGIGSNQGNGGNTTSDPIGREQNGGAGGVQGISIQSVDESRLKIIAPSAGDQVARGYTAQVTVATTNIVNNTWGSIWISEAKAGQAEDWDLLEFPLSITSQTTKTFKADVPIGYPLGAAKFRFCMGSSNTVATCDDGGTSFYSDESDVFQIVDTGLII